ncbi:MAG TPA: adenylate/guanylate cyclase domain-containing protein, partial [Mycobacteriales bacterium]|nr:adenylate/guanylate cyclase domain-containing protein [Mycobacteriales bacterium]
MSDAEVRYASSAGAYVAYQVLGTGVRDLLVMMEGFISVDMMDEEPRLARGMARLGSFARLIRFDRRGIGLSDPVSPSTPPTLEQWVGDAVSVLDAVGSERAIVLAAAEASAVGLLLTATHPDRVASLVVVNGFARALVDVDYPVGLPREALESLLDATVAPSADTDIDFLVEVAPSVANDVQFRQWWELAGRRGASPGTARALLRVAMESDVRAVLPTIQTPTLVIHLRDDPITPSAAGRYVAEHIGGARWVEVPGADDYWWASDSAGVVLDEIEEFATGVLATPPPNRVLSTILVTDIVASTGRAIDLGDHRWRDLLDSHDKAVRRQLTRFRGMEINTTGDGFVATFDGPARAVECACAIRDVAHQLGLDIRAGVHTGEIELRRDDIA